MRSIDARVIIIQLVLISLGMLLTPSVKATTVQVITLSVFLVYFGSIKRASIVLSYFLLLSFFYELFKFYGVSSFITEIFFILRKTTPVIGAIYLALGAMTVSSLLSGLLKLKIPKTVSLAVVIALRFLPTIKYEYQQIKDSLETRNQKLTLISFMKSPINSMEYILIPFMMRGIKIADELSMSAASRGIESNCKRGERIPLSLNIKDGIYFLIVMFNFALLMLTERGVCF